MKINNNNSNSNNNSSSGSKKTDITNGVVKSAKKYEKGKDHVTSTSAPHKCRCAGTSKSSRTTVSMASGGSGTTITASSTAAVLRHLKDLPIREYEKLSPTPPISMVKPSSANDQMYSPKGAAKHNGHSAIDDCGGDSGASSKGNASSDNAIILRIGSLNNKSRHLSSLSINRETGSSCGEKLKSKIKVRTKTDPHPISSSQKLHNLSGTVTVLTNSSSSSSAHTTSKCNCSSCKSQSSSVSNSDNHNKTKSVGTQHDANNAYDPWVRQHSSSSKSDAKASSKTTTITSNSSKSILPQKIQANSNAKVIVITDDFKKKALNQEVFVDTKRNMLRYMRANKLTNSSRSMDDDNNECGGGGGGGRSRDGRTISVGDARNEGSLASKQLDKQKPGLSKSVDNLSQLSVELDQLDNVGSVELIFISDEFLNKVAKPDVIILNNSKEISAYTNRMSKQMSLSGKLNGNHTINSTSSENEQTSGQKSSAATVAAFTDVNRRCKIVPTKLAVDTTTTICVASKKQCNENGNGIVADGVESDNNNDDDDDDDDDDNGDTTNASINGTTTITTSSSKHAKLNRQSSAETSIDDVNNKLTSHAFQSYDEQEHLEESKEIQSPTTEDIPT